MSATTTTGDAAEDTVEELAEEIARILAWQERHDEVHDRLDTLAERRAERVDAANRTAHERLGHQLERLEPSIGRRPGEPRQISISSPCGASPRLVRGPERHQSAGDPARAPTALISVTGAGDNTTQERTHHPCPPQ